MKTWTKYQALSHAILLFLLFSDFVQSLLVLIYENLLSPLARQIYADELEFWITLLYWSILLGIPLIVLTMRLNGHQLQRMNMDRFYAVMLIIALLITLYTLPFNCLAMLALIYIVYMLSSNKVTFAVLDPHSLRVMLLIVCAFVGAMFFIAVLINPTNTPDMKQFLRHFLLETVPISIYEEAVYRGMLYMFLRDLGFHDLSAFSIQAFLFWSKHINYLFSSPLTFWIALPILSFVLSYIVVRSKSLTPSTLVHLLYNVFVGLLVF